jgi:hypothetical protein
MGKPEVFPRADYQYWLCPGGEARLAEPRDGRTRQLPPPESAGSGYQEAAAVLRRVQGGYPMALRLVQAAAGDSV